jgi:hypothetical protein
VLCSYSYVLQHYSYWKEYHRKNTLWSRENTYMSRFCLGDIERTRIVVCVCRTTGHAESRNRRPCEALSSFFPIPAWKQSGDQRRCSGQALIQSVGFPLLPSWLPCEQRTDPPVVSTQSKFSQARIHLHRLEQGYSANPVAPPWKPWYHARPLL